MNLGSNRRPHSAGSDAPATGSRLRRWTRATAALASSIAVLGASVALDAPGSLEMAHAQASPSEVAGGPLSPIGRRLAPVHVQRSAGVTTSSFDLGDIALPGTRFRAPARGTLVVPASRRDAPLVVISHLRSAGCTGGVFAFPCPSGTREVRYDQGMAWLGQQLARQGYAVLIPDVAPVLMGATQVAPYDQLSAWLAVVGRQRDALARASAGGRNSFGVPLKGRVCMSRAALITHSRSGLLSGGIVQAWAKGPTRIVTTLAYGPAYETPDARGRFTPLAPDIPYLAVVGSADEDVPYNAQLWLSAHLSARRTAPAMAALVPGFGHNYVNTALSSTHHDDRIDCPDHCPSAAEHRALLGSVATSWLGATMRHSGSAGLPLSGTSPLPSRLAGQPVEWLAITNGRRTPVVTSASGSRISGSRGVVRHCGFYDPMDPTPHPDACADPDSGVMMTTSHVTVLHLTRSAVARIATPHVTARTVNLQLAPYGDHAGAQQLSVRVTTTSGRSVVLRVPASSAALIDRSSADANGVYAIATLRLTLPCCLQHQRIASITLGSSARTAIALAEVDLAG